MPDVNREWHHPRTLLEQYGLKPRKSFGQNFLVDPNFAEAIANSAAPDEKSIIVEIGPGTGTLTRALLQTHPNVRILAVELDRGLASLMRAEFKEAIHHGKLTLLECDALESKHQLNPFWTDELKKLSHLEKRPRRILCSNLPYQVATPIIANLALAETGAGLSEPLCEGLIATIQSELAQRLLGSRGTKSYGPLAAFLALRAKGQKNRTAGKKIFWPQPKVTSAVISLSFRPWTEVPFSALEAQEFMGFLQKVFHHRRKRLGTSLKNGIPEGSKEGTRRAEQLAPLELWQLFERCTKAAN